MKSLTPYLADLSTIAITTIIFSFLIIPFIRKLVLKLNLGISPNARSSHVTITPGFGGVSFYLSFIFILLANGFVYGEFNFWLIASLTVAFFTGFIDDLVDISPKWKILGLVLASVLVIYKGDFYISNFHGFLGIYELPNLIAVVFNLLLILFIVNAFNLIDGIDGLSSIIGISAFSVCLIYSLRLARYDLAVLSVVGVFSLLSFLPFNFSSKRKIFMGDTGSLFIGFVLALFVIHIFSKGVVVFVQDGIGLAQTPMIAIGLIFVPLFDTFRVMIVRISHRRGVFSPDRNHIHHLIIDRGLSHKSAALIIGFLNLISCIGIYFVVVYFDFFMSLLLFSAWTLFVVWVLFEINRTPQNMRIKSRIRNGMYKYYCKVRSLIGKEGLSQPEFNNRLRSMRNFMF